MIDTWTSIRLVPALAGRPTGEEVVKRRRRRDPPLHPLGAPVDHRDLAIAHDADRRCLPSGRQ